MIKTEAMTIGAVSFIRTYSDAGMLIHGGMPEGDYEEAVDPAEFGRTYTETTIPVDSTEAEELLAILTGESE